MDEAYVEDRVAYRREWKKETFEAVARKAWAYIGHIFIINNKFNFIYFILMKFR